MGMISRFDLARIKKETGISHFVETGTWYGDSSNYALNSGYTVETCEINGKFHFIAEDRFKHRPEVKVLQLPSFKFLPIAEEQRAAVFWLDAHMPNLYIHEEEGIRFSDEIILPLEGELNLIKAKQNFSRSIIIIDDVRIYADFYGMTGNKSKPINPFNITEWFKANASEHIVITSQKDEGYLIAIPKEHDKIARQVWFVPD